MGAKKRHNNFIGASVFCIVSRNSKVLRAALAAAAPGGGSDLQQRHAQFDCRATGGGQDAQLPAMIFHHADRDGEAKPAAWATARL